MVQRTKSSEVYLSYHSRGFAHFAVSQFQLLLCRGWGDGAMRCVRSLLLPAVCERFWRVYLHTDARSYLLYRSPHYNPRSSLLQKRRLNEVTTMEQELLKKLEAQEIKIDSMYKSVEKMRKYFLIFVIATSQINS